MAANKTPNPKSSDMPALEGYPAEVLRSLGFLTEDEVGAIAGITPLTQAGWRHRNIGPAWSRVGNRIFYHADDLKSFILAAREGVQNGSAYL